MSSVNVTKKYATSSTPDKNTPLKAYVTIVKDRPEGGSGNVQWSCNFCNETFNGSYFRVKCHLLKLTGKGIRACSKVNDEYLIELKNINSTAEENAKPKQVPLPTDSKKRRTDGPLAKAFNEESREHLRSEIARMFYSGGLPFYFARNPYYVSSYSYAANTQISGFLPPGYNALRTTLLQREKSHLEKLLQPIKGTWSAKGMSIVTDGWSDPQRRPLINFMATSEGGPIFLKAVDGSKEYKDKHFIASLINGTIAEVGPLNVVQVITDNAPVCKAAGMLIEADYPHIFWTPCVVHTLNLALKNICAPQNTERNELAYKACEWITKIADDVSFIRVFIMNHGMRLAIFNEYSPLKLLAVADTRFASIVVMLKRLRTIKKSLRNMVVSDEWDSYKEDDVGKAATVTSLVLNEVWWDKVDYILEFTKPIYEMLRKCDTDQPTLHLVYEMWDTMIEQVKQSIYRHERKEQNDISLFYDVVHAILIDRWTKNCTPLHCMAHSLNPRYYSREWLDGGTNRMAPHMDNEISEERNKCFRRFFSDIEDRRNANLEFARFSGTLDVFGEFDSLQNRWDLDPIAWWLVHGASIPLLQRLALRLLGQPCSSSCAERNWSTYSFINCLKRNKLHPKRAEDLVYIHSNLRLLSRKSEAYNSGETKMWDIGGDEWDSFDGAGVLEVAKLSLVNLLSKLYFSVMMAMVETRLILFPFEYVMAVLMILFLFFVFCFGLSLICFSRLSNIEIS